VFEMVSKYSLVRQSIMKMLQVNDIK